VRFGAIGARKFSWPMVARWLGRISQCGGAASKLLRVPRARVDRGGKAVAHRHRVISYNRDLRG
jgi:hypothetical protein